jgi:signal transduction histidine kinase
MNNLISNAIKFSHRNTKVTVKLESQDDRTIVTVNDEGQGIPEKELNRLFKFFSRTSVQGTDGEVSTGLGLAISKKIMEAHEGTVRVESQPGIGSTFTIEF